MTLTIISDIIGIPESDRPGVLAWYQESQYSEPEERSPETQERYTDYFDQLGSERLSHPRSDLVSDLMLAVERGGALVVPMRSYSARTSSREG